MIDLHDAVDRACAEVDIHPPSDRRTGRWLKADTRSGRNGKGDGRVMIDSDRVIACNWQTGQKSTVRIGDPSKPIDRKKFAEQRQRDRRQRQRRVEQAAVVASRLVEKARLATHPYLAHKGFPDEKALVLPATDIARIGGDYLVPEGAGQGILLPARISDRIVSVQVIWEDGTKKFLFGGQMDGASFRIAAGRDTWVCEGFATGLSLRAALRAMNRRDAILCGFSAYGVGNVARSLPGRVWIAADNDKPMPQFDGLGTGEHWAREAHRPYAMPPAIGTDFNDLHTGEGIYAVQRILAALIRKGSA